MKEKKAQPLPPESPSEGRDGLPSDRADPRPQVAHAAQIGTPAPAEEEEWLALGATHVTSSPPSSYVFQAMEKMEPPADSHPRGKQELQPVMPVLGDYQLLKKLGQGAMATVFKAKQISMDRKVAIKLLHKSIADNPKLVERFYREARVLQEMDHPNIVHGYGAGEVEGIHYFVMEYVSGVTLQHILNTLGKLSVGDALFITLACARALEYAHSRGLVHRDIKPDNVLITKKGVIKIADLGMVKQQDEDMSLTQTGHAVGTPWYMPLEQARNAKDADARCDIYALGCLLYCTLTGRPPFMGSNIVEVIQAKERGTFPPARNFSTEVPEKLDLILAKMTAKLAKYRYQSCTELVEDLESLGLASASLSFLKTTKSSDDSSVNLGRTTPLPDQENALPPDEWYLRIRDELGDSSVRKTTTTELLDMLDRGEVHPGNKISKYQSAGFRSLATYREFEQAASAFIGRQDNLGTPPRYQNLYREFDQQKLRKELEDLDQEETAKPSFWTFRNTAIVIIAALGGAFRLFLVLMLSLQIGKLWRP